MLHKLLIPARTCVIAAGVLFGSTNAQALCYEGMGYDFASEVSSALDYLVCLHNEQVDKLNEHAGYINNNSSNIDDVDRIAREARDKAESMQFELDSLRSKVIDLESQLYDIENRLSYLE